MKDKYYSLVIMLFSSLVLISCSDVEDEITQPAELEGVHSANTLVATSPDFHGNLIGDSGFEPCQKCHDANFSGGLTKVSCVDCHSTISVHKEGIFSPESPNFHGRFLAENNLDMSECQECHGEEYNGGLSSPGCVQCHNGISVHKEGILNPASPDFHANFIQNSTWALSECSQCHGSDYSGGLVSSSCNTCHSGSNGPESCNTCHGDFSDENRIAPPKDLSDNIETSARGVGAHSSHLYDNMVSAELSCTDCHPEVQTDDNYVFAHINGLPAEMSLSEYNSSNLTCSNTYCHGNFEFNGIMGNNFSPVWNIVDGTQGACGTCHGKDGTPTPQGHFGNFEADYCVNCHSTTFNEDGSLNTITHINGEPNFN